MTKINTVIFLLLTLGLFGCQSQNLGLTEDVTSIDVYQWDGETIVATIEDQKFIDNLINELDHATTKSTASMDFASPDYRLVTKNKNQTLFEIGYYNDLMKLGVEGRYWDFNHDEMYNVKLELPIQTN